VQLFEGNEMLRLKKRKILFLLALLLLILFLSFAGRFLVINEKPKNVDVIVVLSGGEGRLEKALELYEKGYSDKLILSNGLSDGLWEKAVTLLPSESIILEGKADSTYESALYVKEIMEKHQFHSAILVSSDFHMRRVEFNFHRVFKESNDELIYVSNDTSFEPRTWWATKRNVGITVSEYIKIVGNSFGIHGNSAKRNLYKYVGMFFEE
jgi:uncharacterized SAM-binding protein YcdF (DUF218 family)